MSAESTKPRRVSRQVLADHVYQEILASLMDGTLEAGVSISIDGLARDLDHKIAVKVTTGGSRK